MNERIKSIRKSYGLSQEEFGKKLKIGRSSVAKLESGENNPSEQTIDLICREFNINEEWLRPGEGEPKKKRTRNQELQAFANDVMEDVDESFKKRFILALSKLNESDWETLKKIADELSKMDVEEHVIASGTSISGSIHIGNSCDIFIANGIGKKLREKGKKAKSFKNFKSLEI